MLKNIIGFATAGIGFVLGANIGQSIWDKLGDISEAMAEKKKKESK